MFFGSTDSGILPMCNCSLVLLENWRAWRGKPANSLIIIQIFRRLGGGQPAKYPLFFRAYAKISSSGVVKPHHTNKETPFREFIHLYNRAFRRRTVGSLVVGGE